MSMCKVVFQVCSVLGGLVASFPLESDAIAFARESNATAPFRACFTVERSLIIGGRAI